MWYRHGIHKNYQCLLLILQYCDLSATVYRQIPQINCAQRPFYFSSFFV